MIKNMLNFVFDNVRDVKLVLTTKIKVCWLTLRNYLFWALQARRNNAMPGQVAQQSKVIILLVFLTMGCGLLQRRPSPEILLPVTTRTPPPTFTPARLPTFPKATQTPRPTFTPAGQPASDNQQPIAPSPTTAQVGPTTQGEPTTPVEPTTQTNPTALPTDTATPLPPTATSTLVPVITPNSPIGQVANLPAPTPTSTNVPNPTATFTPLPTATAVIVDMSTATPTPTGTFIPPTPTATTPPATATETPTLTPTTQTTGGSSSTLPDAEITGWSLVNLRTMPGADNNLLIYGEMINKTGVAQVLIDLGGKFFDAQGNVIATTDDRQDYEYALLEIPADLKIPFFLEIADVEIVDRVEFEIEVGDSPSEIEANIALSNESQVDNQDDYCVQGNVQNPGGELFELIVFTTLYNEAGKVINFDILEHDSPEDIQGDVLGDYEICVSHFEIPVANHKTQSIGIR